MRFGLLLVLLCGSATAHADVRKQIQAQYDRWSKAYMANDVDTLLGILSPDYTLITSSNDIMTFGAYKAYLKLRKGAPKDAIKYSTKIQKLTLHGPLAEVDSIESMVTLKAGYRSTHRHEYLDKWHLSGTVWRLESTLTLKETTTKG